MFFFNFTTNKAAVNLSLTKSFRIDYKRQYHEDIYIIECVAHTFNNVVNDVLNWLFSKNKDDQIISNYINRQSANLDAKDEQISRYKFFFFNFFKFLTIILF